MQNQLEFNVGNQTLIRIDDFKSAMYSKNYLYAKFNFCTKEWSETEKTVVFTGEGISPLNVLLDEQGMCLVPWEATQLGEFQVSVFTGDVITTNSVTIYLRPTNYAIGETPPDPTPSVYNQIIEDVQSAKEIAQSVRDDADNGAFNGEKGDAPVRGIDYFTEDDVANMESDVISAIQPTLADIKATADQAEEIAKGRATGYVFDTLEDMNTWLGSKENTSQLNLGDNLYIRAVDVPDYWWDGEQAQQLETQKVDLSEYAKTSTLEEYLKKSAITYDEETETLSIVTE